MAGTRFWTTAVLMALSMCSARAWTSNQTALYQEVDVMNAHSLHGSLRSIASTVEVSMAAIVHRLEQQQTASDATAQEMMSELKDIKLAQNKMAQRHREDEEDAIAEKEKQKVLRDVGSFLSMFATERSHAELTQSIQNLIAVEMEKATENLRHSMEAMRTSIIEHLARPSGDEPIEFVNVRTAKPTRKKTTDENLEVNFDCVGEAIDTAQILAEIKNVLREMLRVLVRIDAKMGGGRKFEAAHKKKEVVDIAESDEGAQMEMNGRTRQSFARWPWSVPVEFGGAVSTVMWGTLILHAVLLGAHFLYGKSDEGTSKLE